MPQPPGIPPRPEDKYKFIFDESIIRKELINFINIPPGECKNIDKKQIHHMSLPNIPALYAENYPGTSMVQAQGQRTIVRQLTLHWLVISEPADSSLI